MSNQIFYAIIGVAGVTFLLILAAFVILQKKMNQGYMRRIKELRKGTQEKAFSADVFYQKLYLILKKIPLANRYLLKIRRKLEIIYMQDEYHTRKQAAKTLLHALILIIPITLLIIILTRGDALLRVILLLLEIFLIETIITTTEIIIKIEITTIKTEHIIMEKMVLDNSIIGIITDFKIIEIITNNVLILTEMKEDH